MPLQPTETVAASSVPSSFLLAAAKADSCTATKRRQPCSGSNGLRGAASRPTLSHTSFRTVAELRRFDRKMVWFQVYTVPLPHLLIRALNVFREQFRIEQWIL